jgi:hypothetical protein
MRDARAEKHGTKDDLFRFQLSALGYAAFAHLKRSRPRPRPDAVLLSMLAEPDVDARVAEALPWLVRHFENEINFEWLVRQAKLQNLQNRFGFVLALSGVQNATAITALNALDRVRLLEEATLGWNSMPPPMRQWMRNNRSDLAKHWNILTRIDQEGATDAA